MPFIYESAPKSQKTAKICLKTIEKSSSKFKKSTIWNGLIYGINYINSLN